MKLNLSNSFDTNKAKTYLDKLIERGAKIELKEFKGKRSISQNAYFHAACGILGNYAGYTIDEMKIILKDQLEFMTYEKNTHRFYRSSADLNKDEFRNLVDFTRSFGESNGCYIPTPEEHLENQFEIARELNES